MTASRAVAAIGGTALLVAWIAAAADSARVSHSVVIEHERPRELTRAEQIANDIQSQATRLRSRLASAPSPSMEGRNPFRFTEPPAPRATHRAAAASIPEAVDSAAADPMPVTIPLTLNGIAEDSSPEGTIRTAVLSGLGDVFLAKAGDVIASRFQIVAIGADAVEILDTSTGASVRLGLR